MLYAIAGMLVVLWLTGFVASYTVSGFIHVLLLAAIVLVVIRVIRGHNVFGRGRDVPGIVKRPQKGVYR
jgi:hypothetical protein